MKKTAYFFLAFIGSMFLLACAAQAGPYDFIYQQRNAADNGNIQRVIATPASTGFFTFNADTKLGGYTTLGAGLQINSGVLSATMVPGPKGDPGTPGLNGTNGTNGIDGALGAAGPAGSPGLNGKSAYELATVNGYSGTLQAWLASLKGADGSPGTPGSNGTNGSNGASAYQIALNNGFTGTEPQWVVSLKGAKGDTGSTGAKGDKGDKGDTGATGATGQTGAQGPAGTSAPTTLRLRAQTNTAGAYTWAFTTPFPAGTVPVVGVSVEDATTASFNHSVSNVTNTGFTVTLRKTTAVTLLGISVLGVDTSPQAFVHLTAIAP